MLIDCAAVASAQIAFDPPAYFSTATSPASVVFGDWDVDGFLDLACPITHTGVSILFGDGTATFSGLVTFDSGDVPIALAVADLDGDGHLDLAVANVAGYVAQGDVTVHYGRGDGTFSEAFHYLAGLSPNDVVAADLNGDGFVALATSNYWGGSITVFLSLEGAGFQPGVEFPAGAHATGIVSADFNLDGFADVAVPNEGLGLGLTALLNDGSGGFPTPISYSTSGSAHDLSAADFNEDGYPDLALGALSSDVVGLYSNDGTGGFGSAIEVGTPPPWSLSTGDLDGDGHQDVVVAGGSAVTILGGDGAGTFPLRTTLPASAPTDLYVVPAVDLNADGLPEIALADGGNVRVAVYVNQTQRIADCFRGNVNAAVGPVVDALFLNGSAGVPTTRSVTMAIGETLTVDILNAPSLERSPFVIFVYLGEASAATESAQPFDLGTACFPTPLNDSAQTLTLANGMGHEDQLGTALIRRRPSPAPTRVLEKAIGRSAVVTLQGLLRDDAAVSPTRVAITNAVVLRLD